MKLSKIFVMCAALIVAASFPAFKVVNGFFYDYLPVIWSFLTFNGHLLAVCWVLVTFTLAALLCALAGCPWFALLFPLPFYAVHFLPFTLSRFGFALFAFLPVLLVALLFGQKKSR